MIELKINNIDSCTITISGIDVDIYVDEDKNLIVERYNSFHLRDENDEIIIETEKHIRINN